MASKGRLPPHPYRRPLPSPGMGHLDSIPPEMHPQRGGFPPFDMLPHPEVMEQKLAAQHVEMQKLATENQRFAATHGTLRQDLAAIQHELQMLHNHVGAVKSEREQQIMALLDKLGKMEADLQGAEPLKLELHKARTEAQSLLSARDELVSRVQQLNDDHQRVHMDLQQIPALMSELENLRQEYQHCRATYDYEKKLYNDHLESLQVMEKNYMTMASEVEKLRAELKKHAENDKKAAAPVPYAGFPGHNDKEASVHYPVGQNAYDDAYGVPQGRGPLPGGGTVATADGNTPVGVQSGPAAVRAGYDAYRGPGPTGPGYDMQGGPGFHKGPGVPAYDPQRGHVPPYDPQRGHGVPAYDPQRGPGGPYDTQRGPNAPAYDPQRYDTHRGPAGPGYDPYRVPGGTGYDGQRPDGSGYDARSGFNSDAQRGPVYDPHRGPQFGGPGYEMHRGTSYDSPSGHQGQATTQPAHAGGGFQGAQVPPPPPPPAAGHHPGRR
uniref:protein FLX-like 2 isoform X2 n=1 Tax=Erigeron canadensis TaxID=72917 RepID=UPI001CB94DC8|nr:protein FLX-like 2 isoform X2 [Erigeron canadensis]